MIGDRISGGADGGETNEAVESKTYRSSALSEFIPLLDVRELRDSRIFFEFWKESIDNQREKEVRASATYLISMVL